MDKKGMTGTLIPVAYGIVALAILIGVGLIVITNFGGSQATCPTATCGPNGVWSQVNDTCTNATSVNCGSPGGTTYSTLSTLRGYLGTGSGGLVTWVPAIIALTVGILFLSYFVGGRKKDY